MFVLPEYQPPYGHTENKPGKGRKIAIASLSYGSDLVKKLVAVFPVNPGSKFVVNYRMWHHILLKWLLPLLVSSEICSSPPKHLFVCSYFLPLLHYWNWCKYRCREVTENYAAQALNNSWMPGRSQVEVVWQFIDLLAEIFMNSPKGFEWGATCIGQACIQILALELSENSRCLFREKTPVRDLRRDQREREWVIVFETRRIKGYSRMIVRREITIVP